MACAYLRVFAVVNFDPAGSQALLHSARLLSWRHVELHPQQEVRGGNGQAAHDNAPEMQHLAEPQLNFFGGGNERAPAQKTSARRIKA